LISMISLSPSTLVPKMWLQKKQ